MFVLIFYQIIMDFVVLYESLCQVKLKLKLTPFFCEQKNNKGLYSCTSVFKLIVSITFDVAV